MNAAIVHFTTKMQNKTPRATPTAGEKHLHRVLGLTTEGKCSRVSVELRFYRFLVFPEFSLSEWSPTGENRPEKHVADAGGRNPSLGCGFARGKKTASRAWGEKERLGFRFREKKIISFNNLDYFGSIYYLN